MFEKVHFVHDWYDGPREGVADCGGRPHWFKSEWQDGADLDVDTFLLVPFDRATFELACEQWEIWLRWEASFKQGATTHETHPCLPNERTRWSELEHALVSRIALEQSNAFRRIGEFRKGRDYEVSWSTP